jgi:hypothetical protein
MFYALSSKQQKYFEDRINLFIAIAPATSVEHVSAPLLRFLRYFRWPLDVMNKTTNLYRLFDSFFQMQNKVVCGSVPTFCLWSEMLTYTSKISLDDPDRFIVMQGHLPGGVSLKNLFHFAQTTVTGKFQDWDYDLEIWPLRSNWQEYGQTKPPVIELKNIKNTTVPIALFVGLHDVLSVI